MSTRETIQLRLQLDDLVTVCLTAEGISIYRGHWEKVGREPSGLFSEGRLNGNELVIELRPLMKIFGPFVSKGTPSPFRDGISIRASGEL